MASCSRAPTRVVMTWNLTLLRTAALIACGTSPLHAGAALVLGPDGTIVYDAINNVTWLADADLPATNRFGLPPCEGSGTDPKTCVNASGSMSYQAAAAWVAAMNAAHYLGHTDWQLPTSPMVDAGCSFVGPQMNGFGWNCSASALGSLYYGGLGINAPATAVPIPGNTVGPFANFQPYLYWSQSSVAQKGFATFSFNSGFQGANTAPNFLYVLPMIAGKIPGTPPASGMGLEVNPGGQTIYDPVTNVTWLANANLGAADTFGLPRCAAPGTPKLCVNADGAMNWDSASQFVANMNSGTGYLGQTNWELPPVDASCNADYGCSGASNPMGELFYGQLKMSPGAPVAAAPAIGVGPFIHVQPYLYWSCGAGTIQSACGAPPAPGFEWSFSFGNGFEGTDVLANDLFVTAYFVGAPTTTSGPVNYEGLWWNAPPGSESGWGINVAQQGDTIFATWFTYDLSGRDSWFVMTANRSGPSTYTGTLYSTTGPPFDSVPFNPAFVVATPVGSGTVTFTDANRATFAYTIGATFQAKALTREIVGSPVPTCVFGAQQDLALASNYEDLWWASPPGSESGWGINFTHHGDTIFATWFTYDLAGNPAWFVVTAPKTAPRTFAGTLYQTTGPPFNAFPFDPAQVVATPVGTATLTFADGDSANFAYAVSTTKGKVTQSKHLVREVFRNPGTVCE